LGTRPKVAEDEQILAFGWREDAGLWVLRYANSSSLPRDFGRIHMAFLMEERCRVMQGYAANFAYLQDVSVPQETG